MDRLDALDLIKLAWILIAALGCVYTWRVLRRSERAERHRRSHPVDAEYPIASAIEAAGSRRRIVIGRLLLSAELCYLVVGFVSLLAPDPVRPAVTAYTYVSSIAFIWAAIATALIAYAFDSYDRRIQRLYRGEVKPGEQAAEQPSTISGIVAEMVRRRQQHHDGD